MAADEAELRKQRSIAALQREGVPVLPTLPKLENDYPPRSANEIAGRAVCLAVVSMKGELGDQKLAQELVNRYQLADILTPEERAFIDDTDPTQRDRIRFSWRYEGYGALLWALGHLESRGRPGKVIDVPRAVTLLRELGREGLAAKAKPRSVQQVLDYLDLIYRYHWAVTDARINGKELPAGLNPGVVQERHYALNWLVRYMDQDWDDISTDT